MPEPADPAAVAAALGADYLTFTASSTVRSFMGLLGAGGARARCAAGPRVVSIGPVTSATAREEGLEVHAEAAEHTIPGLVAALAGGRRAVSPAPPVVALLTDFGAGSEHVGALHAVIAAGCPGADRIDLAHDLVARATSAPGRSCWPASRRCCPGRSTWPWSIPASAPAGARWPSPSPAAGALVGPDNGLLGPGGDRARRRCGAVALTPPPDDAPATFHGRDLFAPAAARLAAGAALAGARRPVRPGRPARARPARRRGSADGTLRGRGRRSSTASATCSCWPAPADLARAGFTAGDRIFAAVTDRRHPATVARAFADVAPKGMLVHVDSHGMVALAVNGGNAARRIGAAPGDRVTLGRWPLPAGAVIAAATRSAAPGAWARNSDGSTSSSSSTTGPPSGARHEVDAGVEQVGGAARAPPPARPADGAARPPVGVGRADVLLHEEVPHDLAAPARASAPCAPRG